MYLSSFYKLKFERYTFNARMFGAFLPVAGLWGNCPVMQSLGSYIHLSTIWSTLTSSHHPEESKEESSKKSFDLITITIQSLYLQLYQLSSTIIIWNFKEMTRRVKSRSVTVSNNALNKKSRVSK